MLVLLAENQPDAGEDLMPDTPIRLAGPAQVSGAAATVYTVPGSTTTIMRYIRVVNPTGTARTLTLSIGADAPATRIIDGQSIPAGGSLDWSGFLPLRAAEILQAAASAAAALTITIAGVEVT